MFVLNDDLSIYATRGDIVFFSVSATDKRTGEKRIFQAGDLVRMKIYGKKAAENVVLEKDFPVTEETESVEILLTKEDTKIGEVISKPKDYWYEIELNPLTNPQTIIGYSEDGPAIFKLFPEGADLAAYEPTPEDIPFIDYDLDLASTRPVQNQAIARAIVSLKADFDKTASKPNVGYVIANMGDSIVGNTQDESSVSAHLANITGATTYNFGFGGCRMSTHDDPWGAFCMHSLADAIVSGDFAWQESAAKRGGVPDYFASTVAKMKETDFSKVDIMTIAYGVNDYTASKGLDNANNAHDVEYYGGALRYSLEKIMKAYPNIRPVIVTPCWCYWPDSNGNVQQDSDTRYFNLEHDTLVAFVNKCVEIGNEYHIPVVDAYNGRAINKFNHSHWFYSGDGIHPNENGRKVLAKLISKTISGM